MHEDLSTGPDGHELNHHYEACRLRAYPDPGSPLFKALQAARIDPRGRYVFVALPEAGYHANSIDGKVAVIDGEIVKRGDRFRGAVLEHVGPEEAVLRRGDQREVLHLYPLAAGGRKK